MTHLGNQLGVNFLSLARGCPMMTGDEYCNLGSERPGLNFLGLVVQNWDRHAYCITLIT